VANSCIESPLLKYSAKEYYFRAALCHMCIDLLNAQLAVKKYEEMYPTFSDSRECKLLKLLLDKLEENDVEGFTEAVKDYDSISRLDQWFTNILLRIKRQIEADSDMK
jgi:alpha-soluble NSF attachment protein